MIYVIWDNGSSAMEKFIPLRSLHSFSFMLESEFFQSFVAFSFSPFVVHRRILHKRFLNIFLAHFVALKVKNYTRCRPRLVNRSDQYKFQLILHHNGTENWEMAELYSNFPHIEHEKSLHKSNLCFAALFML